MNEGDSDSAQPGALLDQLNKLGEENEKLKQTIADVFELLNEVDETADPEKLFNAIDDACHYIISDMPDDYQYDDELTLDEEGDEETLSSEAHDLEVEMLNVIRGKMAERLNTDDEGLNNIKDPDVGIPALRYALLTLLTDGEVEDKVLSDEEYESAIASHFLWLTIWSATPPIVFKVEAQKYFDAVRRIKARVPQRRRVPAEDVQKVLDLLEAGQDLEMIEKQVLPSTLVGKEKTNYWNTLIGRVKSLTGIRKRRAK